MRASGYQARRAAVRVRARARDFWSAARQRTHVIGQVQARSSGGLVLSTIVGRSTQLVGALVDARTTGKQHVARRPLGLLRLVAKVLLSVPPSATPVMLAPSWT